MGLRSFEYIEPSTVEEACAILGAHPDEARTYAGGTSILLLMKQGMVRPRYLVNIKKIRGLRSIEDKGEVIRIGALTTHHDLEISSVIRDAFPAIAETEPLIANIRVRSTATIGGNLAFAEPLTDLPPIFIALNARARVDNRQESRDIPLADLFAGYYETTLGPDELITDIHLPKMGPAMGLKYFRFSAGSDKPAVGCAVSIRLAPGTDICAEARIVLGCVASTPLRVEEAEAQLVGREFRPALADHAALLASQACSPLADIRGSEAYKRSIVRVLTARGIAAAFDDAARRR